MLSASEEFDNLSTGNSNMLIKARLTLADGTVRDITGEDVIFGTPCFSEGTSSSSSFDIGACIIGKFNLSLANFDGRFDEYDFTGSTIEPSLGKELSDGSVEWVRRGLYHVDQPSAYGQAIALSSLDNMTRFERPYSDVETVYPATIGTIVRDICNKCGVVLVSGDIPCGDYKVSRRPSDDSLTCLAVLGYALKIACCFAKCRYDGRLQIGWYDYRAFDSMESLDGGEFDPASPYATGDTADGGNFITYASGDTEEGGGFGRLPYKTISMISSVSVCTDDVVITGVSVTEQDDLSTDAGGTGEEGATVRWGKDGYVLDMGDNPLVLYGQGAAVAELIGKRVVGMTFRPFESSSIGDPTMEAGDPVMVFDSCGRGYRSYVTSLTYKVGSYMNASCSAETPSRRSAAGYSAITKAIVDARNLTRTERTERQLAQEALERELRNSGGLYMTVVKQTDGSKIYFLHDKPTMADSRIVWKMTSTAIGISTDGGETWPYGLDVSGTAILNRIYAVGINAKYLTVGRISDSKGRNYWDLDTCEMHLDAGTKVGGKDIATTDAAIKSVTVEYAQNGSRDTPPTAGWSIDAPAWSAGRYIWSRTKTVMQSGDVLITDPVCLSGADGANGVDGKDGERGPAGRDGVSTYFHRAYATSADGRQGFSVSYGAGKTYLGTYVDSTPTDSTDPSKYQWSLIKGADGEDGVPGKNGTDGKTYYLHIAYATSADGRQGFSTTDGSGKKYIGQCVDLTVKDPTDPAKYTWTLFKGADGANGVDGRGIKSSVPEYYLSTSASSATGGSWSTSVPAWSSGRYYWQRLRITWSDGSTSYSTPAYNAALTSANQKAQSAMDTVDALDQKKIFNLLTDNGRIKGLYTKDGQLYINADYIGLGRIAANNGENYIDLNTGEAVLKLGSATTVGGDSIPTEFDALHMADKSSVDRISQIVASRKSSDDAKLARLANKVGNFMAVIYQFYDPAYKGDGCTYKLLTDAISDVSAATGKSDLENKLAAFETAYDKHVEALNKLDSVLLEGESQGTQINVDSALTQQKIFNRLTNNGEEQGIYLQGGKVYLNGEYIKADTVSVNKLTTGNGSLTLSSSQAGASLKYASYDSTIRFLKNSVGISAGNGSYSAMLFVEPDGLSFSSLFTGAGGSTPVSLSVASSGFFVNAGGATLEIKNGGLYFNNKKIA